MKFPEINKPETLEKHYLGKFSKNAMAFMKALLKMDPKERLTGIEALQHPYFDELKEGYMNNQIPEKPILERLESAKEDKSSGLQQRRQANEPQSNMGNNYNNQAYSDDRILQTENSFQNLINFNANQSNVQQLTTGTSVAAQIDTRKSSVPADNSQK
jgi:serine/threonine protein kinase